jgi:hypothetical protein
MDGNQWSYLHQGRRRQAPPLQIALASPASPPATNDDLDIDEEDAAWNGACAEAGGRVGWPRSDAAKRFAFWEWWLGEAAPAAWASASEEW